MTNVSIGAQLKKARQKKQVTINEAYKQTRIHPDILTALEEDNFDRILNPTYIRSFLKGYGAYLGLNINKLLEEYDRSHPKQQVKMPEPPSDKKEERATIGGPDRETILNIIKILAIIITAIILVLSLIRITGKFARSMSQVLSRQAKQAELIKAAKVPAKIQKPAIKEKKAPMKKAVPQEPSVKTTPTEYAEKLSIPDSEKLKLSISVTEDVWCQLKVDGRLIFSGVLKKGSSETWQADKDFSIWSGRAQAMQLTLNGNDLGSPGRGVMKDIVITRQGIKGGR
jgi:cytoskeletal protein RodZ